MKRRSQARPWQHILPLTPELSALEGAAPPAQVAGSATPPPKPPRDLPGGLAELARSIMADRARTAARTAAR